MIKKKSYKPQYINRLFLAGDITKWELSTEDAVNTSTLTHNKTEAIKVMLPSETRYNLTQ